MNDLLTMRRHFGLSQQYMATLLGTSRSMIGAVETGRRSLPPRPSLMLSQLMMVAYDAEPVQGKMHGASVRVPRQPGREMHDLKTRILIRQKRLMIQASLMQQKRDAALATLFTLEKAFPQPTKGQRLVIDKVLADAKDNLDIYAQELIDEYRQLAADFEAITAALAGSRKGNRA